MPEEAQHVTLRGDRQESIARIPAFFDETGLTAQEVATRVNYDDANTYSVLRSLEKIGVLEVVEGSPRRWRYAEKHRTNDVLQAGLVLREGEWTTYGDIGIALYGHRRGAQAVASVASKNAAFPNPYRVLGRNGKIPPDWKGYGGGPERCRELLEAEGVEFTNDAADPSRRKTVGPTRRWPLAA